MTTHTGILVPADAAEPHWQVTWTDTPNGDGLLALLYREVGDVLDAATVVPGRVRLWCQSEREGTLMSAILCDRPCPAQVPAVDSGCITGKPCQLGCSLFCALEPTGIGPELVAGQREAVESHPTPEPW